MSNAKTVTSKDNPAVKRLKSLSLKKHREEEGVFLVEGLRHIHDALAAGWEADTFAFSSAARPDKLFKGVMYHDALKERDVFETTDEILSRITGRDNTQPAIAALRQRGIPLNEIKNGLWVGLEGVRDPGNLGTIMRTIDAVAADGVILIGACCDPWSPETVRATMGSFARVRLANATLAEFTDWRRNWPGRVIGTHLDSVTVDYRTTDYTQPLVLLMGGEQAGLSSSLAQTCDVLVKIPMTGGAESLNLAVSTGIMLYEIVRRKC